MRNCFIRLPTHYTPTDTDIPIILIMTRQLLETYTMIFIINNGQLHERSTYVGWYQPAYAVDQDYRLSEYTFMGMMQYIFYDNEHSQFLQKTSWPPNSFSVVEVPEGYFRDLYLVYADRGFAGTDYPHLLLCF